MTTIDQDRAKAYIEQAASLLSDAFEAGRAEALADHVCPTVPVWRPTTADEIQPGWEVRARTRAGEPVRWGTARTRDGGDWHDDEGFLLTCGGEFWTVETTAPLPEPEPWPEGLVMVLAEVISSEPGTSSDEARAALDHLAERGLIERPKAGER